MNIEKALIQLHDRWPGFANAAKKIHQEGTTLRMQVVFGYPLSETLKQEMREALKSLALNQTGILEAEVEITYRIRAHAFNQTTAKPLPAVKNIIAVASCKGGVGKSTTAVNLAYALSLMGAKTGILDADVYGPNLPQMLGLDQKPVVTPEKKFEPLWADGVWAMSLGYLVDINTPMIWRGPMASKAFEQLLYDTLWPELDYLIVDLPPGTGDIQLTLAQKMPLSGAVMVTTPQTVALLDVKKGIEMFQKVKVPLLGLVENMSLHQCSQCGHWDPVFGEGGGESLAESYQIPMLAKLPLTRVIREAGDQGKPITKSSDYPEIVKIYEQAAYQLGMQLDLLPVNYAGKFPDIRVEK